MDKGAVRRGEEKLGKARGCRLQGCAGVSVPAAVSLGCTIRQNEHSSSWDYLLDKACFSSFPWLFTFTCNSQVVKI